MVWETSLGPRKERGLWLPLIIRSRSERLVKKTRKIPARSLSLRSLSRSGPPRRRKPKPQPEMGKAMKGKKNGASRRRKPKPQSRPTLASLDERIAQLEKRVA